MDERRKITRKQTDQFFGVFDRETGDFIGKLIDLSTKGTMLQSVLSMEPGSIYEFKIDFPEPVAGKRSLSFDGECIWCRKSTSSKVNYDVGFEITEMELEEIETIQYLLNDSLFHDSAQQPRLTLAKKLT
ncbi:MAG: PilZ domain-containing protein [candidate division Zixibacteria bacterium]|nr:PilZ domain-containing protein [candidate division Zixibacteria bacterium]